MADKDSPELTRDIAPFGVRMPAALKERVQAAAKVNNRSTNAEIVATLEEKYPASMPVDVAVATMTEWIDYIEAAPDHDEKLNRISEVNRDLAFHDSLRQLKVELREQDDEFGITESVYITRRNAPDLMPENDGPENHN